MTEPTCRNRQEDSFYLTRLSSRVNTYSFFVSTKLFKSDNAINLSEQRVVPAASDVGTGMNSCTKLSDDNAAGGYVLTAEFFNASPLPDRVASIPGAPPCFLMSHLKLLDYL